MSSRERNGFEIIERSDVLFISVRSLNVWSLLSRSVYGSGRQYDSEKDLKEAIWSAWRHLDENIIKTLISSEKNRCIDVISKKGGITSY